MPVLNRRKLFVQASLAIVLGKLEIAFGASIVAVRIWPSKSYTRLTIESDTKLTVKNSVIGNPPRLAVDLTGLTLNNELKEALGQVPPNDPYVNGIRVGQYDRNVVRIILDLKQAVKAQVFTLNPIAQYSHRLVFDLYPAVVNDPLAEIIDEKLNDQINARGKTNTSVASTASASNNKLPSKSSDPKESATTALIQQSLQQTASASSANKTGSKSNGVNINTNQASVDPLGELITSRLGQTFGNLKPNTPGNSGYHNTTPNTLQTSNGNSGQLSNSNNKSKPPLTNRLIIVALDPGHGGEDPGAIGPAGTQEKNVVLSIALKLREKINSMQFKGNPMRAYLTRDGDYFVPLGTRVKKAQQVQADLFISIHADAFTNPNARGASVFALSEKSATSAGAKWLADKENTSDKIGGVNIKAKDASTQKVLLDMSTNAQVRDSLQFGGALLKHVKSIAKVHKPQVEQAGFAVLKAPDIPSVLVETAFISNPEEERLLKSNSFQDEIADAMLKGIIDYFNRFPPQAKSRTT